MQGNEKGPDTHAENFRQLLSQHMVMTTEYIFLYLTVI